MVILQMIQNIGQAVIDKPSGLPQPGANPGTVSTILGIVFNIAGAIALLMITIGGFKYVISRGNAEAVARAKDTILYSLIGLVVVVAARVIVAFVISRVS